MINISKQHTADYELIEVRGRLDTSNADLLDEPVQQLIDNGCNNFLFDLSKLEYISSYGIRIFVKLLRHKAKVSMVVRSDSVFSILKMTGLEDRLNIKRDINEAKKIFTQITQ